MLGPRRVLVEPVEPRRLLATVTVTSLSDSGAGSLRDAVAAAAPGDTISLAGLSGTITLQSAIDVDKNLVVEGPDKDLLTISGGGNTQLFFQSGGALTISDLTLADGKAPDGAGGGGAIYQGNNSLTLTRVDVSGCASGSGGGGGGGGAIASGGWGATLDLTDCTFTNNTAAGGGGGAGGAILDWGTSATFLRCTFSNNAAVGAATASLSDSNQTLPGIARGGAVAVYQGDATFTNCTITDNAVTGESGTLGAGSAWGGGVYFVNNGSSAFISCTIANNTANASRSAGAGIYLDNGTHTLTDCIVASNFAAGGNEPDIHLGGAVTSGGHNLIGALAANLVLVNGGASGDIAGDLGGPIDPRLDELADNGGQTPTRALAPGSLAIDAGSAVGSPATDQRGQARAGSAPDIGAFEFVPAENHSPEFTSQPSRDAPAGALYTYQLTTTDPDPADHVAISAEKMTDWLTLDDHGDGTATLSGTADYADFGRADVVLRAGDGHDLTRQSFVLDVNVARTALLEDGTLRVNGTDDADDIHVWTRDHGNQLRVAVDGIIRNFPRAAVGSVYVLSFGGNDAVAINISSLPSTVVAGDGNDSVAGGAGEDSIVGGAGKDVLAGNGGDDRLFGGGGKDRLTGGAGDDQLCGQAGDDFLSDRDGAPDILRGAADHDTADVDPGVDITTGIETLLT